MLLTMTRSPSLWRVALAAALLAPLETSPAHGQQRPANADAQPTLPVILLTGFEPFGPGRPPNSSWEGIKQLDGATLAGHRLVCRQLKVLWGEPLRQLPAWIDELRPVAIFSFGQGRGFALECLARNSRAAIADNAGQPPPSRRIVPDGPERVDASLEVEPIVEALLGHGYAVAKSQDAGAYLCEETLYALEYLKAKGEGAATVAFCHVPALGSTTATGEKVTPAVIERFVTRLLETWLHVQAPPTIDSNGPTSLRQVSSRDDKADEEREIRQLIDRYFRTWSAQDVVRYGQSFAPQAIVQMVDAQGSLTSIPLGPFLRSQQEAHRRATAPMTETPESVQVRFDANLAHALVYWKLVEGQRTEYGYDHFTFVRQEGKWRVAHLIFYETTDDDAAAPQETPAPPQR